MNCTLLYAILHQSWCSPKHPLTTLINDLSKLSFYLDVHYTPITPIKYTPIHHHPIESSKIFSLSFSNNSSSQPSQHLAYSHIIHTFMNTSMMTKPRVLRNLLYDVYITTAKPPPYLLQNPARYLLPIVQHTHPYYTTDPPSTHY